MGSDEDFECFMRGQLAFRDGRSCDAKEISVNDFNHTVKTVLATTELLLLCLTTP